MDIFDMLDETARIGKKEIVINWLYNEDDDSSQECGEEFAEDYEYVEFNIVEIAEEN
jgi:hypothetical protein